MPKKKTSSLEQIGYIKTLPKNANLNDYESILIKKNDGEHITFYRLLLEKEEVDETTNFNKSWDIFNLRFIFNAIFLNF